MRVLSGNEWVVVDDDHVDLLSGFYSEIEWTNHKRGMWTNHRRVI